MNAAITSGRGSSEEIKGAVDTAIRILGPG